jgi:proline iminopeptidase
MTASVPPRGATADQHMCMLAALLLTLLTAPAGAQERQAGELFPVSQPFDSGYLDVGEPHEIHYELHGNPQSKPVFVLHGGPGFGCYPRLTQYFNPDKFLIVLHDQRGSGQSRPHGELRDNTTQQLVEDIERLRKHLKIDEEILIFGGSWGSTLALAYAETYPDRVAGMVLRGVFTATDAEIEQLFLGQGVRKYFPDAVARLEAALPPDFGEFSPQNLTKLFTEGDHKTARKVSNEWVRFGVKIGSLHTPDEKVERALGGENWLPMARIDCYYMANRCFLEEGQLLRDADRLKDIPTTIINGRYDMICPPVTAWRLHQRLPKSKLIIIEEAGHSEGEPDTTRALVEAMAEFE